MRIVIPTGENSGYLSKMGAHFGKAPFYTIITTNDNGEIVDVEGVQNLGHGANSCGNAVANILALKVKEIKGVNQRGQGFTFNFVLL